MTAPHTYITTTIPYVNARPHIGFALELVQPDVLARYRRAERTGDLAAGERLDVVLGVLLEACSVLGRVLTPFLPDAAARITLQCTPGRDGRLPSPSPVFRRLSVATAAGRP